MVTYRRKPERVTATVLKGEVTIDGTKFHEGDYLVQTDGGVVKGMHKEAFEATYEVDPAVGAEGRPSLSVNDLLYGRPKCEWWVA